MVSKEKREQMMEVTRERRDVMEAIINVMNDVIIGIPEIDACQKHGIKYSNYRNFIAKEWKILDDEKISLKGSDYTSTEDLFLNDLLGRPIVVNGNFDEIFDIALSKISERTADIIRLYYCEDYTYDEIAQQYNITRTSVSSIINNGLRRMRHPSIVNLFTNGIKIYEAEKVIDERTIEAMNTLTDKVLQLDKIYQECEKVDTLIDNSSKAYLEACPYSSINKDNILYADISELGLSVRAHSILKRYNVNMISDILKLTYDDCSKMKNLGRRCMYEIVDAMHKIGFYDFSLDIPE